MMTTTTTTEMYDEANKFVDYEPIYYDNTEEWINTLKNNNISEETIRWATYVRRNMEVLSIIDDEG